MPLSKIPNLANEEERYWRERDYVDTLLDQLPYFIFWKDKNMEVELRKAKEGAELANIAKTEFIRKIEKEIRTVIMPKRWQGDIELVLDLV